MSAHIVSLVSIPVVTIFVRHSVDCPNRDDAFYKRCRCSKHLRWTHGSREHRRSAKTRSWSIAEQVKADILQKFTLSDAVDEVSIEAKAKTTIEEAVELLLIDKRSQGVGEDTLLKYKRELDRFTKFMAERSKFFPHEIQLQDLTKFRENWENLYPSTQTQAKVQERLMALLRYCFESRMIDRVPNLSTIKVDEPPTMPLTDAQYTDLLSAIETEFEPIKAQRVRALVQLMRYSGLAITDAVVLERTGLIFDPSLQCYKVVTARQKTGTDVCVVLPKVVSAEIVTAMPLNRNPRYIFWNTGNGKRQSAVTNWQHDLRQAFRAAGQKDGHPHQLRDTFAVWLLQKGVPIEEVSQALGHKSIKVTEKHYAKWVVARQNRLDTLLMSAWDEAA